jgi:flagellar capping protein FliD
MIKFIVISLSMLFYLHSANAESYHNLRRECRRIMQENPPQINVDYVYGKLKVDSTKTSEELLELSKKINPLIVKTHKIQGLTKLMFSTKINIETKAEMIDQDTVCVIPKVVNLHLYHNNPTIYLVNDLEPDTCRWNLVLRHEQTHLDIGHYAFKQMAYELKKKLKSIIRLRGSRIYNYKEYIKDDQSVAENMLKDYEKSLRTTVKILENKLLRKQAELDTAENYQKETKLCNDEE